MFIIFVNGVENTGQSAKRGKKPGLSFYRPRPQISRDEWSAWKWSQRITTQTHTHTHTIKTLTIKTVIWLSRVCACQYPSLNVSHMKPTLCFLEWAVQSSEFRQSQSFIARAKLLDCHLSLNIQKWTPQVNSSDKPQKKHWLNYNNYQDLQLTQSYVSISVTAELQFSVF